MAFNKGAGSVPLFPTEACAHPDLTSPQPHSANSRPPPSDPSAGKCAGTVPVLFCLHAVNMSTSNLFAFPPFPRHDFQKRAHSPTAAASRPPIRHCADTLTHYLEPFEPSSAPSSVAPPEPPSLCPSHQMPRATQLVLLNFVAPPSAQCLRPVSVRPSAHLFSTMPPFSALFALL